MKEPDSNKVRQVRKRARSFWSRKHDFDQVTKEIDLNEAHQESVSLTRSWVTEQIDRGFMTQSQLDLCAPDAISYTDFLRSIFDEGELITQYLKIFVYKLYLRGYNEVQISDNLNLPLEAVHEFLFKARQEFPSFQTNIVASRLLGETMTLVKRIAYMALGEAEQVKRWDIKIRMYNAARQAWLDMRALLARVGFYERETLI